MCPFLLYFLQTVPRRPTTHLTSSIHLAKPVSALDSAVDALLRGAHKCPDNLHSVTNLEKWSQRLDVLAFMCLVNVDRILI